MTGTTTVTDDMHRLAVLHLCVCSTSAWWWAAHGCRLCCKLTFACVCFLHARGVRVVGTGGECGQNGWTVLPQRREKHRQVGGYPPGMSRCLCFPSAVSCS